MPSKEDRIYSAAANAYLAPYATLPEQSRGRRLPEADAVGRSPFQRDRDRIIHSTAFRRLEYKTQVFIYHEGDHFRTRLTHSLEVAQLARSIARELALDEDLAEAVALAHDLGHTPFGHAGEDALSAAMAPYGGFDHNAQTLRILTQLEQKYAEFDGLNLTWECLEGMAKHNGPVRGDLPRALAEVEAQWSLELGSYAGLEAQVAALSDDIAYNNHDLEDGIRAGLFTMQDLTQLPVIGAQIETLMADYATLDDARLLHEAKRRTISLMVRDIVATSEARLQAAGVSNVEDVRAADSAMIAFSDSMYADLQTIRTFLFDRMYRHYKVNRMTTKAGRVIGDLFAFFMESPDCLPDSWHNRAAAARKAHGEDAAAVVIADYIAGMTDRYALLEHQRIFDLGYKLIGS